MSAIKGQKLQLANEDAGLGRAVPQKSISFLSNWNIPMPILFHFMLKKVSLKVRKVMFETISYFKKALFQLDSLHQVYKYTVHFVPSVKLCSKTF